MRKLLPILQIIDLVLLLLSLYFHNDMLLIVAAVVIAVCVVLTFRSVYKELHADHETGAADNK